PRHTRQLRAELPAPRALRSHLSAAVARSVGVMSPRPDLGPRPRLGYAASPVDRAADRRSDADAMRALESDSRARAYVIGGELIVLRKTDGAIDPLFPCEHGRASWRGRGEVTGGSG